MIDELIAIAGELGRSPAQVALNWLLQRPGVTSPIIGVRTMQQLDDNLNASGWALNAEHMARLNGVSEQELPYPYSAIAGAVTRR